MIAVGLAFSTAVPGSYQLTDNVQISGRTSPTLLDVAAASATGLAGAIALARRDVGAVLPGVAIAISLVPPLAVVGVCLGFGEEGLALGAMLLFSSNLLALVLAGTLVFAVLGYSAEAGAEDWVSSTPSARVTSVDNSSTTFVIHVETSGPLPPTDELLAQLEGEVPDGLPIVVQTTLGRRIQVGAVGDESLGDVDDREASRLVLPPPAYPSLEVDGPDCTSHGSPSPSPRRGPPASPWPSPSVGSRSSSTSSAASV